MTAATHTHTSGDHSISGSWTAVNTPEQFTAMTGGSNYYLTKNIDLSSTWTLSSGTVNLCLNGYTVKQTGGVRVITIQSGATLNLYDCSEDKSYFNINEETGLWEIASSTTEHFVTGGVITAGYSATFGGYGGCVHNSGTFNMHGGNIVGNKASNHGGGVYSTGSSSEFNMHGGSIVGNTVGSWGGGVYSTGSAFNMYGGNIVNNTAISGGGVYSTGSGSVFTMYGGKIANNTATQYTGGGVDNTCTFTMYGGKITNNTAKQSGGGVYNFGTFTISSGEINGNTALEHGGGVYNFKNNLIMHGGNISYNTAIFNGGGVSDGGKFAMYGGSISYNSANGNGGGVDSIYNPEIFGEDFTLYNGNITNNTALQYGGGVYYDGHLFKMEKGNITGNSAVKGGGVYIKRGDSDMLSGNITENYASDSGGGIEIEEGTCDMYNGNISYNTAFDEGGGVNTEKGEFIMHDGNIVNNTGQRGGGLSNLNGTFNMKGGNIAKNYANEEGGGVFNLKNIFTMNGGNITGNKAPYGGGVYDDGDFNMHNGNITNNIAKRGGGVASVNLGQGLGGQFTMSNGNITENIADTGGGVYFFGPKFTMHNGNITKNRATNKNDDYTYVGGGVFVTKGDKATGGEFEMYGGNITDNTATDEAPNDILYGGIYTDGKITLSGTINITGNYVNEVLKNIYLRSGETIKIGSAGLSDSSIGVTTQTPPLPGEPVDITEGSNLINDDYKGFFFADNNNGEIDCIEDEDTGNNKIVLTLGSYEYTVIIPDDIVFPPSQYTYDNEVNVTEMDLMPGMYLSVEVRSANGFDMMIQESSQDSDIPYAMTVGDSVTPLSGDEFIEIMRVPADTTPIMPDDYFMRSALHYSVNPDDVAAAKFAGEYKDTLTFKVEVKIDDNHL